jgi:hypothetical protein
MYGWGRFAPLGGFLCVAICWRICGLWFETSALLTHVGLDYKLPHYQAGVLTTFPFLLILWKAPGYRWWLGRFPDPGVFEGRYAHRV